MHVKNKNPMGHYFRITLFLENISKNKALDKFINNNSSSDQFIQTQFEYIHCKEQT